MTKQVYAVGVIFENEKGQILVLRRHPQDPEGTTWGLAVSTGSVTMKIDQKEHTQHMWETPMILYGRKDLMIGLYPILEDVYGIGQK